MHNRYALPFILCMLLYATSWQPACSAEAKIDCFNPGSTVESAVCSDQELLKSYKLTEEAYQRVQSNPAAVDIYIDLLHARSACVKPKSAQSYKFCIIKREFAAFNAFNRLTPGRPRPIVGHGAPGTPI